jgi:transcriptional regulator
MYSPKPFDEPRIEVLHELIRARPLATLVTLTAEGLDANHIPLQLVADAGPFGTLRGHIARANPLCSNLCQGAEVLAVFHGPNAYISPSWYPTKTDTGAVVPTWNYAVVHARGTLGLIEDAAWLREHLDTLTAAHEGAFPTPWRLSDAPPGFIDQLMAKIVGIEILITRLSGKWKMSQNQLPQNQAGVARGLRASGDAAASAAAALVEEYAAAAGTAKDR